MVGLTKFLASYFGKYNIRVNSISPGGIFNKQDKKFVKKINQLIPLKRMAKHGEYKEIIQFLCSDASSYLTGQNIVIDGGRSIIWWNFKWNLGVVPARPGSKSIKHKNIKKFDGKPLLAHSIIIAKRSKKLSTIIFSSDLKIY